MYPGDVDRDPEPAYRAATAELGASVLAALVAVEGAQRRLHPPALPALRAHCRAQEALYPLRRVFPPLSRYFAEPSVHDRLETLERESTSEVDVGIQRGGDEDARGGFWLYVPESYDGTSDWPLVVALHGGFGSGREFLWTWLREARSRRFLLLAPTSRGPTWPLQGVDRDGPALGSMIEFTRKRWRVDAERILLTGLSDGATYALLCGLAPAAPFTAIAVVCGVLHPANFSNGNLERASGRRIYVAHGALDWMFPVTLARMARDELERAGADLCYREIEDLSHAYPREENDRILSWFDAGLSLG